MGRAHCFSGEGPSCCALLLEGLIRGVNPCCVGTERSARHMVYVISEDYLDAFGHTSSINSETKWRAKRDVVEWLTFFISKHHRSPPISRKKLIYVAIIVSIKKPPSDGFWGKEQWESGRW